MKTQGANLFSGNNTNFNITPIVQILLYGGLSSKQCTFEWCKAQTSRLIRDIDGFNEADLVLHRCN
jgi:hypothetical protein